MLYPPALSFSTLASLSLYSRRSMYDWITDWFPTQTQTQTHGTVRSPLTFFLRLERTQLSWPLHSVLSFFRAATHCAYTWPAFATHSTPLCAFRFSFAFTFESNSQHFIFISFRLHSFIHSFVCLFVRRTFLVKKSKGITSPKLNSSKS